jgi:hypothetical protein
LFTSSIATGYSSLSKWPLATSTEGYSSGGVRARVTSFFQLCPFMYSRTALSR